MFDSGKISFISFIIIVILFVVGGYFLMDFALSYDYSLNEKENITEITDYRLDKTKDYIYFTNIEYPITGSLFSTQVLNINIIGFEDLSNTLNESESEYYTEIIYEKDLDLSEEEELFTNKEGIYSIIYREYSVIEYSNYITIIINDYEYNIKDLNNLINLEVYIIDKLTNKLVEEDEILEVYEANIEEIKNSVKEVLEVKEYSDNNILITSTMDNFEYLIYPNKVGLLEIMYKVTSTNNDYYAKLVID